MNLSETERPPFAFPDRISARLNALGDIDLSHCNSPFKCDLVDKLYVAGSTGDCA